MPATPVTPTRSQQNGNSTVAPVAADLVNGNTVPNVEGLTLHVKNSGGTAVTVTLITSAVVEGLAVADIPTTVEAGSTRVYGHFSRTLFGDVVEFSCSAACDVSAYR